MSHADVPETSLLTQVVLAGRATAAFDCGRVQIMSAGELFHIPAVPRDSWVVGDQPCVSLHFPAADHHAAPADR